MSLPDADAVLPAPPASFRFAPIDSPPRSADRRENKRFALSRPGKVFRRLTQTYTPVTTRDLSRGGAMIEVESEWVGPRGRGFTVGEIVDVGVSFAGAAVVRATTLAPAVVLRVQTLEDGRQAVALRYIEALAQAKAA